MKGEKSRLFSHGFLVLVIAGVLGRLVFVAIPGNALQSPWSGGSDTGAYVLLAQNLLGGKGYTYAGQPTAFRPPGYPLLLAAFTEFFGKHYVVAMRGFQFLEGLAIVLLCAAMAGRIFGETAKKAALLLGLFIPTLVELTGEILTETTAALLTCIFLFFLVRYREKQQGQFLMGMSIAIGLGSLVRPNLIFLELIALLVVCWQKNGGSRLRGAAIVILAPSILMSPWIIRNLEVFHGGVLFSTQGGPAAATGIIEPQGRSQFGDAERIKDALGWVLPQVLETNDPSRLLLPSEPEIDRRSWQVAYHLWRESGWGLIPIGLKKVSYFWLSTDQIFWTRSFPSVQRTLRAMGVFAYWIILALAIIGWFSLRRERRALAQAFLLYVLLVTVLHLPFNMSTRYRIPLMDPLLVVLGAGTMATLADRRSQERPRTQLETLFQTPAS
jgi:4-amino-4-deoxy-L-arabinose transferase-like glycosyltransferase